MEQHSSSVALPPARDAKPQLSGERWNCREYGSPRGTYFIQSETGESIAQSLKCGPERARLIAAAPDLLEALQRLTVQMNNLLLVADVPDRFGPLFNEGQQQAQAAIAKAEGQS